MSFSEASRHLRIPFEDIKEATKNFTTEIGRGGYGPVYRGQLSLSGVLTTVAAKQLDNLSEQGLKQFLTEIHLLSRYKHPNLVSLVGFCDELNYKFLIYEYAELGSLDRYLKPTTRSCPLTWKQRINICIDVARGLDHLHNHVAQHERVIHRDIKSANILIDHNWKAMIADFGLSKIGRANEQDTYLITNACGTPGYCDPVYFRTWILTKESDVYSFGVVLVEVICGRLCSINANDVNNEERLLTPWAQSHYKEEQFYRIIDPDLMNYRHSESMEVFTKIAFQCLDDEREKRPPIDLVLQKLEKALKLLEIEESFEMQAELEEASRSNAFAKRLDKNKGYKKELSSQEQRRFRAFLISRMSKAYDHAHPELPIVNENLNKLEVAFDSFSYDGMLARDTEKRDWFSNEFIALLLTLDAIEEGAYRAERVLKRAMVDKLEAMLDAVDPKARGGKLLSLKRRTFDLPDGVIHAHDVDKVLRVISNSDSDVDQVVRMRSENDSDVNRVERRIFDDSDDYHDSYVNRVERRIIDDSDCYHDSYVNRVERRIIDDSDCYHDSYVNRVERRIIDDSDCYHDSYVNRVERRIIDDSDCYHDSYVNRVERRIIDDSDCYHDSYVNRVSRLVIDDSE